MNNNINQYFDSNEKNRVKSNIIFDIQNGKLSRQQVYQIIDIINKERPDYWEEDQAFKHKDKGEWNSEYLHWLNAGVFIGNFTPRYLLHFAEAADYVYNAKRKVKKIIIGVATIVVVVGIIALIINMLNK